MGGLLVGFDHHVMVGAWVDFFSGGGGGNRGLLAKDSIGLICFKLPTRFDFYVT